MSPIVSPCPRLLTIQLVEKWFAVVGTPAAAAVKDLNLYQEQVSKIEQAELVSPKALSGGLSFRRISFTFISCSTNCNINYDLVLFNTTVRVRTV